MRQWISLQRDSIRATLGLRRAFIDAGVFVNLPFARRLWLADFQFIGLMFRPIAMQVGSALTLFAWRLEEQYCKTADRLLGGVRIQAFVERCARRVEETGRKLRENDERLQEISEARFDLRLLQETLTNPYFVVTPHTDQGRH